MSKNVAINSDEIIPNQILDRSSKIQAAEVGGIQWKILISNLVGAGAILGAIVTAVFHVHSYTYISLSLGAAGSGLALKYPVTRIYSSPAQISNIRALPINNEEKVKSAYQNENSIKIFIAKKLCNIEVSDSNIEKSMEAYLYVVEFERAIDRLSDELSNEHPDFNKKSINIDKAQIHKCLKKFSLSSLSDTHKDQLKNSATCLLAKTKSSMALMETRLLNWIINSIVSQKDQEKEKEAGKLENEVRQNEALAISFTRIVKNLCFMIFKITKVSLKEIEEYLIDIALNKKSNLKEEELAKVKAAAETLHFCMTGKDLD